VNDSFVVSLSFFLCSLSLCHYTRAAKPLKPLSEFILAALRHIAGTKWGINQYLKMDRLEEVAVESLKV